MKSAVWFFLGIIFGAAGGAYVAKSIAEKKAEDRIEKATIEARDYYRERYAEKPPSSQDNDGVLKAAESSTRIYGKAFSIYTPSELEKVEGNVTVEYDENENAHYITPITAEEYDSEEEYTKCELDYYADGVLTDEMGNDVEDPAHIVGGDTLDSLCAENRVAYVRNDTTRTVYEVCYIDTYYESEGGDED